MKFYYLSTKANSASQFEIHHRDCPHLPNSEQREYLGAFNSGKEALQMAIHANPNASLCPHCCPKELHIRSTRSKKQNR
ncbi:hypothetical protein [Indibacter alkaliphilus]|uniref:hypothetical protein n=1 Tax=Indibacter alkaliphilus TaxID=579922 RepID=UPI0005910F71|nr:hypothetical protein [Indibacter alkaliphilus]